MMLWNHNHNQTSLASDISLQLKPSEIDKSQFGSERLGLTGVRWEELGDDESCRTGRDVHHGPGGLVEQGGLRVDPGHGEGPVSNIETNKSNSVRSRQRWPRRAKVTFVFLRNIPFISF